MLIYESEGFFEVEEDNILDLYRSTQTKSLTAGDGENFELQALLCRHKVDGDKRCHVGFFSRTTKRTLVFSVKAPTGADPLQQGMDALKELDFPMEAVNLRLSPAMRQVVLRDIPGILSPDQSRKLRAERMALLDKLREAAREDPEGKEGKKAKVRLDAEERLDQKAQVLRDLLNSEFVSDDKGRNELQVLSGQVEDLTARLEKAEVALEKERAELTAVEGINAAAEKRIRELEEILLDAETKSAGSIKDKQKIVELQNQVAGLTEELQEAVKGREEEQHKQEGLIEDVRTAHTRVKSLEEQLAAEKARLEELEETSATLTEELTKAKETPRDTTGLESSLKKAEEKIDSLTRENDDLQAQVTRLQDAEAALEKRLEEGPATAPEADRAGQQTVNRGMEKLETKLDDALTRLAEEVETRQGLEQELDEAHKLIDGLEKALKKVKAASGKAETAPIDKPLTDKLKAAEAQLEQEQLEHKKIASDFARAEKRIAELKRQLESAGQQAASGQAAAEGAAEPTHQKGSEAKPLPHELRPPPKKGAAFHPDWDLAGLPCESAEQVLQAWESAFNVQISLEGYPSQYCSAFLILLKVGKEKNLFMLFRLKKTKHTLVSVPAKKPKNEAELKKTIQEGLRFLRLSGFELSEMVAENVAGALGPYFMQAEQGG